MKTFWIVLAAIAVALIVPFFLPKPPGAPENPNLNLPWQITQLPDGNIEVFGLTPGTSTLFDAQRELGTDRELAVMAEPNETGRLEAYWPSLTTGFVQGKLFLSFDLPAADIEALKKRAVDISRTQSAGKKYTLAQADALAAESLRFGTLTLRPSGKIDEATLFARFGQPTETLTSGKEETENRFTHYLYPDKGLAIERDPKGKVVLQYVAPADFGRIIRTPLLAGKEASHD
ncbi:MAG: hypothetical protein LBL69_05075 [Zoogloeaceae bacterium]|jgi:hypothetical protein|nr:hypothetical protein [Zoogloeaceae bacterium]